MPRIDPKPWLHDKTVQKNANLTNLKELERLPSGAHLLVLYSKRHFQVAIRRNTQVSQTRTPGNGAGLLFVPSALEIGY
jgi:hypothetical protein